MRLPSGTTAPGFSPWASFSAEILFEADSSQVPGLASTPDLRHLTVTGSFALSNRHALAGSLGLAPFSPKTCRDYQLVLYGYERWGTDLPQYLSGRFAFVVYDSFRHAVFACVDHFGSLPLLYRSSRLGLVFASDMRTMLATPGCPRELNLVALPTIATFDSLPDKPGTTLHKHIRVLPPGHALIADARGLRLRRYWTPRIREELVPGKEADIYEHAHYLVEKAVTEHLDGHDRVAIMLSGGLDSSALAVTAAAQLRSMGKRLLALCAVNDPAHAFVPDERRFMEQIRSIEGVDLEYVDCAGRGPFDGIEDPTQFEETPRQPTLRYLFDGVFSHAAKNYIQLLLHGGGGELGISSNPAACFLEAASRMKWRYLSRELSATAKVRHVSALRLVVREIRRYYCRSTRRTAFFLNSEREQPQGFRRRRCPPVWPDSAEAQLRTILNMMDRCDISACQSPQYILGCSQPLFNKDLVEFCLAVPGHYKLREGYGRYIIRSAFANEVPSGLIWRQAQMWGSPDYNWRYNRQIGKALEFVRSVRTSDPVREIVDLERLLKAVRPIDPLWRNAGEPNKVTDALMRVPGTINLINFLRQFPGFGA